MVVAFYRIYSVESHFLTEGRHVRRHDDMKQKSYENACYRTHIWPGSSPYTGDIW